WRLLVHRLHVLLQLSLHHSTGQLQREQHCTQRCTTLAWWSLRYLALFDEVVLEVALDLLPRQRGGKGERRLLRLGAEVVELLVPPVHRPTLTVPHHVDHIHLRVERVSVGTQQQHQY